MIAAVSALFAVALLMSACAPSPDQPGPRAAVRRLDVHGAEIHYVEEGRGEVVVLLHGTATDFRIFDELRPHLRQEFRFVAYSRRHHAPNAWPDAGDSYSLNQHAEDLAAFVHALGVERAHVVAVSMGARVAAHAAVRYPEIFRTLTLSDGLLAPPTTEEGKRAMQEVAARFKTMFANIRAGDADAAVAAYVDIVSPGRGLQGMSPTWQRYYRENARTLALAVGTMRPPSCEALQTIRVPVLVLTGDRTPRAIQETNDALLGCLPRGAEYARVPRAGHYWYADNPADGARLLMEFLRKHRAS